MSAEHKIPDLEELAADLHRQLESVEAKAADIRRELGLVKTWLGWLCPVCGQVNAPWKAACDGTHELPEPPARREPSDGAISDAAGVYQRMTGDSSYVGLTTKKHLPSEVFRSMGAAMYAVDFPPAPPPGAAP